MEGRRGEGVMCESRRRRWLMGDYEEGEEEER